MAVRLSTASRASTASSAARTGRTVTSERCCNLCVFRVRDEGGNGNCMKFERRTIHDERGVKVKESVAVAWARHLALWPTGCVEFKVGDLRPKPLKFGEQLGFDL